ncbi:WASH complex subunit 4 [Teleopsis dalmanni]|uniref:WASH complex subunit 4 n=1 Tax=Teleopsis dalmanni TaxID=139649 RepID=UPI0018CD315C|nr:WASH complex subunit 4 [Teleopsis dalmanni]
MDQSAFLTSAEEQLKNFGSFLNNYDAQLANLLNKSKTLNQLSCNAEPLVNINYTGNQEQLQLIRLLESDRLVNKILLTFAYLCEEVDSLVSDSREMQMKFLYLDEDLLAVHLDDSNSTTGSIIENERVLIKMSQCMEFLCNIQFLLQRCTVLGNNILHQCGAFLATEDTSLEFRFFDIFEYLSELLLQILIFDEIFATSNFCRFWPSYKKTVDAVAHNRDLQLQCTSSEISGLQNCLQELDILFSANIFQYFLDSTFALKEKIGPTGIGLLIQQCNEYVKYNLALIDKWQINALNEFNDPKLLIRLNAFCVVFHTFCGQIDSKHVKHLLELNAKHQGIMLISNVVWIPKHFLKKHAYSLIKTHEKLLYDVKRQWQHYLNAHLQTLQTDCRKYCIHLALWSLNVEKMLNAGAFYLKLDQFKELAALLLSGLRYAGQLSFLVKGLVNAHVSLQIPMTKQTLLAICKMIEVMKSTQNLFQKHSRSIAKIIHCILQYLQYKLLHLLGSCKKKITSTKMLDRNVDALAAIKIAEKCLNGTCSQNRILTAKLAVNATNFHNRCLPTEMYEKFRTIMERIELLSDFEINLKNICDTSYIYWHQSILTAYLKHIVDRKMDYNSFQNLIRAADNCTENLDKLQLSDLKITDIMKKSNFDNIRNGIISNLCAHIETFLRLEVHSNLQLEKMNPFEQSIDDYRDLINACPIRLNGNYIILRDNVENYLSAMFYNLTTISLHDWKTYEEMRHLANKRLMLKPVEDYLPNQTLDQGIDILEIMRKINIFVSKYVYNMNAQIFVEQQSQNKHLDSIGIRHVANSLRTHGSGVINTTVNFTYQFLRQKFYTFSQFLYDEQIKSRLMKEFRSYTERKQNDKYPLYPYERADAFNKDIRKLGLSKDGQTYMDLFRKVITHVGNAMGYIRLVRSGSIHANYSASLYLPKFDENLTFAETCKKENLHDVTFVAAENLEANINNLVRSFSDSTDYFKILIEAFQPFFHNAHNIHLKTFFLIIPPLTLNYVEYMLSVKEKINRKDRQEAVLFDDGFAVGLAYILKLLNQINEFNSLNWFGIVRERFETELKKIKEMLSDVNSGTNKTNTNSNMKKSENEKLQQTLALTERRINIHQMEYNLLYYNIGSAKIFF